MNTFLVVQDPQLNTLIKSTLCACGHSVVSASDGEAAWRLFGREDFALVVVDWDLPERAGPRLCRRLQQSAKRQDCVVLALAGQEALEAGVDDYIEKPVQTAVLEARLRLAEQQFMLRWDRARMRRALEEMASQFDQEAPQSLPVARHHDRDHLISALKKANGNRTTASRILGISRATLYRRMARLGLVSAEPQ